MIEFVESLKTYLKEQNLDTNAFAEKMGVRPDKIKRWLKGVSYPKGDEISSLDVLGISGLEQVKEIKERSSPSLQTKNHSLSSPLLNQDVMGYTVAPFVANSPESQKDFFNELISMQFAGLEQFNDNKKSWRLSLIKSTNTYGETGQSLLEKCKPTAKHWNSNYGSHGFHRYVGRFPPHLVRAILNYFSLAEEDTVLDPFLGSGTTLVEARLLGIKAIGVEICPLSALISRVKSCFPNDLMPISSLVEKYELFYEKKITSFLNTNSKYTHQDIIRRRGNPIQSFPNLEKWFTKEALLGVSITVEFIEELSGFEQDFFACALSSSMRSIGNLDVDVVRAEYSKTPRKNVDVKKLVIAKSKKFLKELTLTCSTHREVLTSPSKIKIIQSSILDAKIKSGSISAIVTSPPYGVEALSYLRTHLLSYRSLVSILKYDPYSESEKIIGSEYLPKTTKELWSCSAASRTFQKYFSELLHDSLEPKLVPRAHMMMQFFDHMASLAINFRAWLKPGGKVAFVIGNKKIGESIVPTDAIIRELFEYHGLAFENTIKHKLKTNNSNSEVPWQENIIQDEYIMFFSKKSDL